MNDATKTLDMRSPKADSEAELLASASGAALNAAIDDDDEETKEEKPSLDLSPWHVMFKTKEGRDTTLSDKVLNHLVTTTEGRKKKSEWIALMIQAEKDVAKAIEDATKMATSMSASGNEWIAKAIAVGMQVDDTTEEHAYMAVKGKEMTNRVPILMEQDLRRQFGVKLDTFPVPGTDEEDVKNGYNGPVDKIVTWVPNPEGGVKKETTSFWDKVSDNTKRGREITVAIDGLKKAAEKANDTPAEYQQYMVDKTLRRSEQAKWKARRNTVRTAYKRGMNLYLQFEAIAGMPAVGIKYLWENDEATNKRVIKNTPNPIKIFKAAEQDVSDAYSVSQVLSMDVKAAMKKNGTLEDLVSTMGRGTPVQIKQLILTKEMGVKEYDQAMAIIGHWSDINTDEGLKHLGQLASLLNAEGSDPLLVTLYRHYEMLDVIMGQLDKRLAVALLREADKPKSGKEKIAEMFKTGGVTGKAS